MKRKLVMDVGGTMMKYALMDEDANIYQKGEVPTPIDSLDHFLDTVMSIYETVKEDVDGLAFSLPGNIDSDTGQIFAPGALLYNAGVNIIEKLQERIALPIAVENDGKCAALAEVWKGNLQDVQSGIVLIIGTGIGGGIIHERKLIKGSHFFAGEVSYLKTDLKDNAFMSCFAMKGSTTALVGSVAAVKGMKMEDLDGKKVFAMIQEGDKEAIACLEEMCNYLAAGIYNLQCLLDPDRVLIGGGISKQPLLVETIRKQLEKQYEDIPFSIPHAQVDVCAHFNDSNLIGALYNYNLHIQEDRHLSC